MCLLIHKGISGPPSEWSRARRPTDQASEKEKDLEEKFRLVQDSLVYGSVALMRVRPDEYDGEDTVPFIVGRKAPCVCTSRLASDGMFSPGDIVVWIHDLEEVVHKPGEYDVPNVLADQESRAIPLKSIAGLGQGSAGYMEEVPASRSELTTKFRLRCGVVKTARSNLVLMSLDPKRAFADFRPAPLSMDDECRAFVRPPKFDGRTVFRRGFTAPTRGRGREWNGQKKLDAKVLNTETDKRERRHYYQLEWTAAGAENPALELAPEIVDEGYIELALQRR